MAAPVFRSKGAFGSGTTSAVAAMPAGFQANDILLIICESSDSTTIAGTPNTPANWTSIFEETQGGGATGVVTLTVFAKRATGSETDVTVDGVLNHIHVIMLAYSGAITTGTAWTVGAGNGANTGNGTITGLNTPVNDCVVIAICASTRDANNTANFSAWANANLTGVDTNERHDQQDTTGAGGGFGVSDGTKAAAGATGDTTVTIGVSAQWRAVHVALSPAAVAATLTAGLGTFTETGVAASVLFGHKIIPDVGGYAESGVAVSFLKGKTMAAALGTFTETGVNVSFPRMYILGPAVGAFTETGIATGLRFGRKVVADVGSYIETGMAANLLFGRKIAAELGTHTEMGITAGLLFKHLLSAGLGSYTESGIVASLLFKHLLAAGLGSYVLTGVSAGLVYTPAGSYVLSASVGSYILTGLNTTLTIGGGAQNFTLTVGVGSYVLAGQNDGLLFGRLLVTVRGTYTLTGQPTVLLFHTLIADPGSYALTGNAIDFIYTAPIPEAHFIYVVPFENRIYVIPFEAIVVETIVDRTLSIPVESRMAEVAHD
jgi:hypothetical protein